MSLKKSPCPCCSRKKRQAGLVTRPGSNAALLLCVIPFVFLCQAVSWN